MDLRQAIEEIKANIDIVALIGERIALDRHNKALCPFHDEKTPSFSVNQKGQYFHCFGCGIGGDVIRFIEHYEKVPFMDALKLLATQAGIGLSKFSLEEQNKIEESRIIEQILTESAIYYHDNLTSEARSYLTSERNFAPEIIARFRLGYAKGGLQKHLINDFKFPLDLCIKAGVVRKNEGGKIVDYFYNRIIFPNIYHGRVVFLTGRELDGREPKYKHIPREIYHLYNEDALLADEVILVEGAPDCLTLVQNGFNSVGLLGAFGFKPKFASRFCRTERVYLCFDSDDAGEKAATKVGDILADKAIMVRMPEGTDVNDYFKNHSSEDFQKLLDTGKPYIEVEIETIKAFPENIRLGKVQELLPKLARLPDFLQAHYVDVVRRDFGVSKSAIKIGIDHAASEKNVAPGRSEDQEGKLAYSESEKKAALELLNDPSLLERLISTTEKLECVGEENNQIIIFLTLLSRILENPISLIVKGDSSGGKSFLVETICQLFPSDEILAFTTLTPKALYHRPNDLSHRALVIYERSGAEESDYSIRSLQSEKKLIISMPVKNEKTGKFETVDHEVKGPVACIETTTRAHLHPENETRCFDVFVDDSEKQTMRIQEAQRKRYRGGEVSMEKELRPWKVAQYLLTPYRVHIPYIDLIKFPSTPLRVRRDFPRFMSIIEVSAVLHQHQREKKMIDGVECLAADIEDYALAYSLAATILAQTIKQISPKAEHLIESIQEHVDTAAERLFTRREVADFIKWDMKTAKKYLDECVDLGLIEIKGGGRGVAYQYEFVKLPDNYGNLLLDPDELRAAYESINLSKKGKVIQMLVGQVNSLADKGLREPIQQGQKIEGAERKSDQVDDRLSEIQPIV